MRVRRAINTIQSEGLVYYGHNYLNKWLKRAFLSKKNHARIDGATWREINFQALNLKGSAKLLLNPSDTGFSKEFNAYGFREPLNTFAIFSYVSKEKPAVLDIGGNLGYFPLVELKAGAKKVVVVEPVPSTFSLLSRTLSGFKRVELLNIAISDSEDFLKLYVSTNRNVTSSSKLLIMSVGHAIDSEIDVKATTLKSLADQFSVNMIRLDVEGHEYRILSKNIPSQINCISVELHVLPPYSKTQAINLLQGLYEQGFKVSVVINEMDYAYYPLVHHIGLRTTYNLAVSLDKHPRASPYVQTDPSFDEVVRRIPEKGGIHLMLQR